MFVLYEMQRDVRIEPVNLDLDRVEAVTDELNQKLSNRVMMDVGLCMALWDIQSLGDGIIYQGDAGIHCEVKFRYIVFRPFQDEIVIGKIKNCTSDGVHVTLGFFDDILIPPEGLQYPSKFDEQEQIWIWEYRSEHSEDVHNMYMDKGEPIRFRVNGELFIDTTPIPSANQPTQSSASQSQSATSSAAHTSLEVEQPSKTPYSLTASINEPGLGLLSWWN